MNTSFRLCLRMLALALIACPSATLWAQEDVKEEQEKAAETKAADTKVAEDKAVDDEPAEEEVPKEYTFAVDINLESTPIKSQDQTGTCWCFATASFIESELIREGKGQHELSEMFIVKNIYKDKAQNYLLRKGKTQFSEGALAHDFLNAAGTYGLVPDEIYTGLLDGENRHNHSEMAAVLEGMLNSLVKRRSLSDNWDEAFGAVLDTYLGASPKEFSYQGENYTPKSFAEHLGFSTDNYVNFTSYTHHPFGRPFVLEIPDNFSNGSFENVPLDRMVEIIDQALENGFTVAWDGDVSERGFSQAKGVAVLPADAGRRDALKVPGEELVVTQEMRQDTFLDYSTTDDHLMHLVGKAHDQHGAKYYIIKNSWGETGDQDGYLYMSEAYVRLKTVAVIVHKDGVGKATTTASTEAVADPAESVTSDGSVR